MNVFEMFWSFQGEGARAGCPSIFLRLAGCSLKCPYCDTPNAITADAEKPPLQVPVILRRLKDMREAFPHSQVVITGGEPMEQDLSSLVEALKKSRFFVSIETNGLFFQDLPIDWWTVSPKDAGDYVIHDQLLPKINEIKLVVNKNLTEEVVRHIRAQKEEVPIYLQPDGSDPERYGRTFSLYRRCQETGIKDVRAGIQLHKVYDVE